MHIKKLYLAACLLCLIGAGGCSPKYYIPNTQNLPLIQEAKQINLTFAANGNQTEFQGAYGLDKQFALQANIARFSSQNEENGNGGAGNMIEAGPGYYRKLNRYFLAEAYGLLALGKMENHFPDTRDSLPATEGKISANITKWTLQPSISFVHKHCSISLSNRFSLLNYSRIDGSLYFEGVNEIQYLNQQKNHFLLEPAITARVGINKVKLQIQWMKSLNVNHRDFKQDDGMVSFGIYFNFNACKKD